MIIKMKDGSTIIGGAGHIAELRKAAHIVEYDAAMRKTIYALPPIDDVMCDCGKPATWWEENRVSHEPLMFFFCPSCANWVGAMKKLHAILGG